jgi:hypothetical protein
MDVAGAIQFLEGLLAKEETDRFKGLIGHGFANPPGSILLGLNDFIRGCNERFDIRAVYLEMNGFDINYDRWYFDFFGYAQYGADPEDLEWLCHWQSPRWPEFTLEGLEVDQKDFEWYDVNEIWKDKKFARAKELAVLLVMSKFVSLIQAAVQAGDLARPLPVLATAHDFDIIGRFEA